MITTAIFKDAKFIKAPIAKWKGNLGFGKPSISHEDQFWKKLNLLKTVPSSYPTKPTKESPSHD